MERSILDIIAQSTAKTIEDVSKLYRETYDKDEPPAEAPSHAETPKPESDDDKSAERTANPDPPSFSYGTPFTDIMRFTRDVEVFTRHIDTQTRGSFRPGEDGQEKDKEK